MRVLSFQLRHTSIVIKVDDDKKSGHIASPLRCPSPMDRSEEYYNVGIAALEQTMLQHAINGVNVNTPSYLQGVEAAINQLDREYL